MNNTLIVGMTLCWLYGCGDADLSTGAGVDQPKLGPNQVANALTCIETLPPYWQDYVWARVKNIESSWRTAATSNGRVLVGPDYFGPNTKLPLSVCASTMVHEACHIEQGLVCSTDAELQCIHVQYAALFDWYYPGDVPPYLSNWLLNLDGTHHGTCM